MIVNAAYKLPILELFSSNMLKLSVEFSPAYGTNGRFENYTIVVHIYGRTNKMCVDLEFISAVVSTGAV